MFLKEKKKTKKKTLMFSEGEGETQQLLRERRVVVVIPFVN